MVRAKILSTAVIRANVVGVLTAVEFDDDESLGCAEIDDEGADSYLAPELDSVEAVRAQVTPEDSLWIGLIMAQASSAITRFGGHQQSFRLRGSETRENRNQEYGRRTLFPSPVWERTTPNKAQRREADFGPKGRIAGR